MENKPSKSGKKRFWICASLVASLLFFLLACKVGLDLHRLSNYRVFIETRHASQIEFIEQHCQSYPEGSPSEGDRQKQEQVVEQIQKLLSGNEIFCASWSSDGHHGLETLKPMETGFTTYHLQILGSHNVDSHHSLYYGKTFDDRHLLVYEGQIGSGGKRHYQSVFLLDAIQKAANPNKLKE